MQKHSFKYNLLFFPSHIVHLVSSALEKLSPSIHLKDTTLAPTSRDKCLKLDTEITRSEFKQVFNEVTKWEEKHGSHSFHSSTQPHLLRFSPTAVNQHVVCVFVMFQNIQGEISKEEFTRVCSLHWIHIVDFHKPSRSRLTSLPDSFFSACCFLSVGYFSYYLWEASVEKTERKPLIWSLNTAAALVSATHSCSV